jgi:dynein heavy chain
MIFQAKAEKCREMEFNGQKVKVLPSFSVFLTMNPGYAGRSELPINMKGIVRSVSMMLPDYATIIEVILFSKGFTSA